MSKLPPQFEQQQVDQQADRRVSRLAERVTHRETLVGDIRERHGAPHRFRAFRR
jgi:hypothetical protein